MALARVVDRLVSGRRTDELWLTLTVLTTVFPSETLLLEARRNLATLARADFFVWLLAETAQVAYERGRGERFAEVLEDKVVAEVDGCARSNRNTGIQRVVRETMSRWYGRFPVRLVAWNDRSNAFQDLTAAQRVRVLQWGKVEPDAEIDRDLDDNISPILVPWRCRIILPEVCTRGQSAVYESIGRYSGNTISAIGYDCIPLVSPEALPPPGGTDFLHYLRVLREAEVVSPISRAATAEFDGFFSAVAAQNRPTPRVVECELAADAPPSTPGSLGLGRSLSTPLLVAVGTHEPRKNHLAILQASEILWREGLEFEVMFLGGAGFGTSFDTRLEELIALGRPVSARRGVSDDFLWSAYREAAFTLFPSLHEGYGLPVAESIACGTPVITTDYGSTLEIAERGGALVIDPRSDAALVTAMRDLLSGGEALAKLSAECRAARLRTWDDYSDELWAVLTAGATLGAFA
ncbi:glycosyltransferase [Frondihabitans sucicola]|uniref:glycosyltransferase n=1 Tax=Frondihabitans sucicola TaxID=1268041 RepID=UPI002572C90F|nr:glycosyltransferase [Frondihabitans sucicola]